MKKLLIILLSVFLIISGCVYDPMDTNLFPDVTDTYDVGSGALTWDEGHFVTVYSDFLVSGNITGNVTAARDFTLVVAASDSNLPGRTAADYICDGVADDVQINIALNALPAGGGRVALLEGTYVLADPIVIPDDSITLNGQSVSTFIDGDGLATGEHGIVISSMEDVWIFNLSIQTENGGGKTSHCIFIEDGSNNFIIRSVLFIDSDSSAIRIGGTSIDGGEITNCHIDDSDIHGIYADMDGGSTTQFINITNNLIERVGSHGIVFGGTGSHDFNNIIGNFFRNIGNDAIQINDTDGAIINNNNMRAIGEQGIFLDNVNFSEINNNSTYNTQFTTILLTNCDSNNIVGNNIDSTLSADTEDGIYIDGFDNVISSNYIEDVERYGILVTNERNLIIGNTIVDSHLHGIYINDTDNLITNNFITDAGQKAANTYHGIVLTSAADRCSVIGNTIINDGTDTEDGVHLDDGVIEVQIANNYIYNLRGSGIVLTANNDDCQVTNNYIQECDDYGVRVIAATCDDTSIMGNTLQGNVIAEYSDNGTNSKSYIRSALVVSGNVTPSSNATLYIGAEELQWNGRFSQLFLGNPTSLTVASNRIGGIVAAEAIRSEAAVTSVTYDGGTGLWVSEFGTLVPDHRGVGSFDLTGGAFENQFTSTTAIFEQSDADLRKFIVILSEANYGQAAEIVEFIDASNVALQTWGWTADFAGATYALIVHPILGVGDGGRVTMQTGSTGNVEIESANYTNGALFTVELKSGADGNTAVLVEADVEGYADVGAIEVEYKTGNMSAGDHGHLLLLDMNETGAVSSNSTTEVDFIELETTNTNDLLKHGIHIGQGFDSALTVSGGDIEDPDHGYEVTAADASTDRVNGIPPGGTAFLESSASDVIIFDADNDYILIGDNNTFETIEAILVTGANQLVLPLFYYSSGNGTWTLMSVSDTTNDFTQSGVISFSAPELWVTTSLVVPAGDVINTGYYIKIVRTRNNLGSPPVEDYFKIYATSSLTDFEIRGDGTIRPVEMADVAAPNNSLYFSTTQNKLVYKDSTGTVHDLW